MNYSRISFLLLFLFFSLITSAQATHRCTGIYQLEFTYEDSLAGTIDFYGTALVGAEGEVELITVLNAVNNHNSPSSSNVSPLIPIGSDGSFDYTFKYGSSVTGTCDNLSMQGTFAWYQEGSFEGTSRYIYLSGKGSFKGRRTTNDGPYKDVAGYYHWEDYVSDTISPLDFRGAYYDVDIIVYPNGFVHHRTTRYYQCCEVFFHYQSIKSNGRVSAFDQNGNLVKQDSNQDFDLSFNQTTNILSLYDVVTTHSKTSPITLSLSRYQSYVSKPNYTSGDFDKDGNADVLWRDQASGSVWIYLMNGTEITQSFNLDYVDTFLEIAGLGDFNDDTQTDILWRNNQTGALLVALMEDTAVASTTSFDLFSDLFWFVAGVGDFDNSGTDDILWRRSDTGENRVTPMSGGSPSSNTGFISPVGLDWDVSAIGDFNGDGHDDILWRNQADGHVWMYLMNSSSYSSTGSHVAYTSLTWDIKDVGDFNGDGKDDILWRNNESGRVWAYYMDGPSIINGSGSNPGEHVAFSSVVWDIKKVDDFNGDGKDDIFWRNDTTGENWIYLMDGVSITQEQSVSTVSDLNWNVVD